MYTAYPTNEPTNGVLSNSLSTNGRIDMYRLLENKWKHTPDFVRPARPFRCLEDD
jgi:hypothetical protein